MTETENEKSVDTENSVVTVPEIEENEEKEAKKCKLKSNVTSMSGRRIKKKYKTEKALMDKVRFGSMTSCHVLYLRN